MRTRAKQQLACLFGLPPKILASKKAHAFRPLKVCSSRQLLACNLEAARRDKPRGVLHRFGLHFISTHPARPVNSWPPLAIAALLPPTTTMSHHQHLPVVHYSNGAFLVFRTEHAKLLRRRRIMNQAVAGGAPASPQSVGPPYCISTYAAHVIASLELAHFVHLKEKQDISLVDNQREFANRLVKVADQEKEMFLMKRMTELKRHNLPVTEKNLGRFEESKTRLTISETPDKELASYEEQALTNVQVLSIIIGHHLTSQDDRKRLRIYHDLYERGMYVSSGIKFGSDFLAYMGDPVRYHAQYAARLVTCAADGAIDLSTTDISEINCLQRLTHTANKIPLYATVDNSPLPKVRYWTLKERVYLNPGSKRSDLELVEPRVEVSSYEQIKIRRTA